MPENAVIIGAKITAIELRPKDRAQYKAIKEPTEAYMTFEAPRGLFELGDDVSITILGKEK